MGADALVCALLANDVIGAERLQAFAAEASAQRPGLMVWAAAQGRLEVVRLLARFGFDVNAFGRSDVPVEQPWQTALHQAAGDGDIEMTRLLLSLGADPNLRDRRFGATPSGWARHSHRPAVVALLGADEPAGEQ